MDEQPLSTDHASEPMHVVTCANPRRQVRAGFSVAELAVGTTALWRDRTGWSRTSVYVESRMAPGWTAADHPDDRMEHNNCPEFAMARVRLSLVVRRAWCALMCLTLLVVPVSVSIGQEADPLPTKPDSLKYQSIGAGEFTPGTGFDIIKTTRGSLNVSVYGVFRYINQMPAG